MKKISSLLLLVLICTFIFTAVPFSAVAADNNLALNKTYTVSSEANNENAYPNLAFSDTSSGLTDGKKGKASNNKENWVRFYRGLSYSVVVDLGDVMYINGINAGFLNEKSAGILVPRTVKFAVSTDGTNFSTVYSKRDDSISLSDKKERVGFSFKSDEYYEARYVRLYFTCDVFSYADEIEVLGTSAKPSNVAKSSPDEPEVFPGEFASYKQEILDGASNIVLIYNGKYYNNAESNIGFHSADQFIPYASYIDKSGKSLDTMFDSFLFLPLAPGNNVEGSLAAQRGWEIYLQNTIGAEDNTNLTALDAAVGTLKAQLDLPDDYKVNIFMTVPTINYSDSAFGKLDGNVDIIPNTLENEQKIAKWFVDLCENEFNSQNFQNLRLTGFYWYSECVLYSKNPFDTDLIKYFTSYCHSKEHAAIWIPYYGAPGFWDANELGFDVAALQSGFAFPKDEDSEVGNPKKGTCYDSMSIAKKYGLGVEFELQLVDDALYRYSDYLAQAYKLGCMDNGVTMYYQGGYGDLANCAKSSDAKRRHIYDLTYKYIKRTYSFSAPYMDENEITLVINKNNKRNIANLEIKDNDSLASMLKITDLVRPSTGSLSLDGAGFVFFAPDDDFFGEDVFTFYVSDGDNTSEQFTVKLLIYENTITFDGYNTALRENKTVVYDSTGEIMTGEFNIIVDKNGIVISIGDDIKAEVPSDGLFIALNGENAEWAKKNVQNGQKVICDLLTSNIAFLSADAPVDGEESDVASEAQSLSPDRKDGADSVIIWIVTAVAAVIILAVVVVIIKKHKKE